MNQINILLCVLIVLIHHTSSLPTNYELRSSVRQTVPVKQYSHESSNRETEIPDLTTSLFREYQNSQNNHHQILKSGNIDLNALHSIKANLYLIAAKFVNSVKSTVSYLTSPPNNDGTVHVVKYVHPVPPLVTNSDTNNDEINAELKKNFTVLMHDLIENQFTALAFEPNPEKTYKPYASGYEYRPVQTNENYKPKDEDRRTRPTEIHEETSSNQNVDVPVNKFTDIFSRNSIPKEDINSEVENIDFFSDLTVPDEKPGNIFLTNSEEILHKFPGLNLTEISLPDEDSLNVFVLNSRSNVVNVSSLKLNPNEGGTNEEINQKPKLFKVVYNFPLPLADKNNNFKSASSQIFQNFETSTFSSFRTELFEEQALPKLNEDRNNFVSSQENLNFMQLPKTTTLDRFKLPEEIFLPSRSGFQLENVDKIVKKSDNSDYSSLGEIPLEESPVFDLKKQDLTNSYGRKVTKFRRQTKS